MGSKSGFDHILVLQEFERQPLEIGVGFGLEFEYRDRPVPLMGEGGFVIPISALNQTHPNAPFLLPSPFDQADQIRFAVLQVGLECDTAGGTVSKGRLLEHRPENSQGQVLQLVTLHVEIYECTELVSTTEYGAE